MLNVELLNFVHFLTVELQASSPIKTGNMQRSIGYLMIDDSTIDIFVAVQYATYVNDLERSKHYHWIQRVLERATRAFFGTADVTINYDILEGSAI